MVRLSGWMGRLHTKSRRRAAGPASGSVRYAVVRSLCSAVARHPSNFNTVFKAALMSWVMHDVDEQRPERGAGGCAVQTPKSKAPLRDGSAHGFSAHVVLLLLSIRYGKFDGCREESRNPAKPDES